jgi:PASTA domain
MKKETIATASLLIALVVMLFGNNIFQQLTGHSIVDAFRPTPRNQPPTTSNQACLVPQIEGLDQTAAELALSQLGLQTAKTTKYNVSIPAGIVISQDPLPDTRLSPY